MKRWLLEMMEVRIDKRKSSVVKEEIAFYQVCAQTSRAFRTSIHNQTHLMFVLRVNYVTQTPPWGIRQR